MSLQVAPAASIPISLSHGGVYRLDGVQYCLTNGAGGLMAFLANFGTEPAIVTGTLAGAGWLVIVPGDAYAIGWDGAAWRALRMVDARVPASEDSPSKVRFSPRQLPVMDDASADTPALVLPGFLVEGVDGTAAHASFPTIAAFLAGTLPTLAGPQSPTAGSA